jgi:DNA polymerase-3 subunit delta
LKLAFQQLAPHLERELASAYLLAGDEPLLVSRALERVRDAAKARGFEERELHVVDRSFRWAELESGADNLSLFATRRIVELRLASPRPGDAGARVMRALVERPDPDRLVIVAINGKLDAAASRSAWAKSFEKHGVRVDIWPVERAVLPRWIAARARELGLKLDADAAELLADRVEGNLLAADQELRKLSLTASGPIDEAAVLEAVANSARFDVFRLTEALVAGDTRRSIRVLEGLRAEGVQAVLVSWALGREISLLAKLKFAILKGEPPDKALARHGVWRNRQPDIKRALSRLSWRRLSALLRQAAEVDNTVKGAQHGQPWDALTALVIAAVAKAA